MPPTIHTREKLHDYLHHAIQLEHATIPPYLLALYSLHPGTNNDASQVLRVVVVEEMLHMTLAANLLNAVGGRPNLCAKGFLPLYPTGLPDGETDFEVSLAPFSLDTLRTFLKIERPGHRMEAEPRMISRQRRMGCVLGSVPGHHDMHYWSIGDFYKEIIRGIEYLHGKLGDELFCKEGIGRQVSSEHYYYNGGGKIIPVTDRDSALAAVNLIIGQGEGADGQMFDEEGELAHYYRFKQLELCRYYQKGDKEDKPSGPPLKVDYTAVYPVKTNARLADYVSEPELEAAAVAFNDAYRAFLALLNSAFNGEPELLLKAVPEMCKLREQIYRLIHNPLPGTDGLNASPTFEIDPTTL